MSLSLRAPPTSSAVPMVSHSVALSDTGKRVSCIGT
jgi:hypothetical protein